MGFHVGRRVRKEEEHSELLRAVDSVRNEIRVISFFIGMIRRRVVAC